MSHSRYLNLWYQVISANAKLEKLHSTLIYRQLALESFLISINELLLPETYKFRRMVFKKSKELKLKVFVRQGLLYIKRNKKDVPVAIHSESYFNDFLEQCPSR